ncbi:hypothetical protein [Aeromonas hydrophila]|uniref:hypothetical protein n=1 Tax=Aeromonas hydrophila TaxID=644 RepID=UPI001BFD6919|nr:hypothetical protein [Aeromonas hydrophila]
MRVNIKHLFLAAFIALTLLAHSAFAQDTSFRSVQLAYGISLDVPSHWTVLSLENRKNLGAAGQVRIPVKLNSDSGICEHHFRKVCGQGFCEQKLSFEGRHLFDSPNKPAAKRSAAVVDPGHWSMTVHLTSEFVL